MTRIWSEFGLEQLYHWSQYFFIDSESIKLSVQSAQVLILSFEEAQGECWEQRFELLAWLGYHRQKQSLEEKQSADSLLSDFDQARSTPEFQQWVEHFYARSQVLILGDKEDAALPKDLFLEAGFEVAKIKGANSLQSKLNTASLESGGRIVVFDQAFALSERIQNALLKTIEEPHDSDCFIFFVQQQQDLLPTIGSRSVKISLVSSVSYTKQVLSWLSFFQGRTTSNAGPLSFLQFVTKGHVLQEPLLEFIAFQSEALREGANQNNKHQLEWGKKYVGERRILKKKRGTEEQLESQCLVSQHPKEWWALLFDVLGKTLVLEAILNQSERHLYSQLCDEDKGLLLYTKALFVSQPAYSQKLLSTPESLWQELYDQVISGSLRNMAVQDLLYLLQPRYRSLVSRNSL